VCAPTGGTAAEDTFICLFSRIYFSPSVLVLFRPPWPVRSFGAFHASRLVLVFGSHRCLWSVVHCCLLFSPHPSHHNAVSFFLFFLLHSVFVGFPRWWFLFKIESKNKSYLVQSSYAAPGESPGGNMAIPPHACAHAQLWRRKKREQTWPGSAGGPA